MPDCGAVSPGWSLTAVVLLVIVSSELETVVTATHQVSSTPSMAIIDAAVQRSITVTLAFTTRGLWCATSPSVKVPATTSLVCWRLQGDPGPDDGGRSLCSEALWQVTAVIFRVVVQPELTTVVTPTHQLSLATLVAVVLSAV